MTSHAFRAAHPIPVPRDFTWWKDGPRRATCTCGWVDPVNYANRDQARDAWRTHRQEATA